jgi:acetyl-CoA carboxylase carboxyl transferase subunit alpha
MAQATAKPVGLQYLPFEDRISQIDRSIAEINGISAPGEQLGEIRALQQQLVSEIKRVYGSLTPWQTVQVARHPQRPLFQDYLAGIVKDPRILHGDRCFGDDPAIVTALGQIGREKVMIIGQEKGRDIKQKIACSFGCPNPEGYRKALAKMKLAEKFGLPIVTFIDTPGAYPGIGAEERGQAQAIAVNLREMSRLRVPILCIVIGEGGSGGALGIGVGDRLAMLENAYYSVISPEGCAGILWHDGTQADKAAQALRLTARALYKLGLIDEIIPEPLGGAHRNQHDTLHQVELYIGKTLRELKRIPLDKLLDQRYQRICRVGDHQLQQQLPLEDAAPATTEVPRIPDRLSITAQLEQAGQIVPDVPEELETIEDEPMKTGEEV